MVTAAALTVTANAETRAYGAANPPLTYVVGGSGLLNGDTLTGLLATTATVTSSDPGPYAIIQGTLAASTNYTLTYIGANLIVTAATTTPTDDTIDIAQSAPFPSSFSAIVIPGNDNDPSANLLSDSGLSACSPESVSKRLRRFGRVELTGGNAGSCK